MSKYNSNFRFSQMAVNFPSSPELDDVFYPASGGAFRFDGDKWVSVIPNPNYADIMGPQGATGPKGDDGAFVSGQDAEIGVLTVDEIDMTGNSPLAIKDSAVTKFSFAIIGGTGRFITDELTGLTKVATNRVDMYNTDLTIHNVSDQLTCTFAQNGDLTATGNVTAYSDISLKENIEEISDALEKVSAIRGVTYDRKDLDGARHAGVIAQEVEAVLPEVIATNEDGIKTVAYGNLVGLLVEAIKELREEVETLKGGN